MKNTLIALIVIPTMLAISTAKQVKSTSNLR